MTQVTDGTIYLAELVIWTAWKIICTHSAMWGMDIIRCLLNCCIPLSNATTDAESSKILRAGSTTTGFSTHFFNFGKQNLNAVKRTGTLLCSVQIFSNLVHLRISIFRQSDVLEFNLIRIYTSFRHRLITACSFNTNHKTVL